MKNVFSVFDDVKKLTRAAEKVGPGVRLWLALQKVDLGTRPGEKRECNVGWERSARSRKDPRKAEPMIRISSHPLSYRGSVGCGSWQREGIERTVWSRVRSEATG